MKILELLNSTCLTYSASGLRSETLKTKQFKAIKEIAVAKNNIDLILIFGVKLDES